MQVFPAMIPLSGRRIVILGGGELARRKARLAAKTPARLTLIASQFDAAYEAEFAERAQFERRLARQDDLAGAALAIVAETDLHRAIAGACLARRAGVLVNVVDRPEMSDWTMPAIVDRGSVVAAIATGGAAPILARDVRAKLEAVLPQRLGALAALARGFRQRVKNALPDEDQRRRFWERALRGPAAAHALAGDDAAAQAAFEDALASPEATAGVVHIVGAGPGDPELLTLKALRLLQDADIVFYDSLVGDGVLDLIRRDAERVFVGKRRANHAVPQSEIEQRLIAAAQAGQRVVRLKGGDPFVFGRGGEELQALQAAGVDAHVVPGVSSALAAAASAGAPLTHRDHAQAVTFVTGYGKAGADPDVDWPALARANQTVVVFMGVSAAPAIAKRLIAAGRDGATPVAVVENASLDSETIVRAPLSGMAAAMAEAGVTGPALLIIGEVTAVAAQGADAAPQTDDTVRAVIRQATSRARAVEEAAA